MIVAGRARSVDVGAAAEEDRRDDGGLEEAELERVLGDVERDHVRHARDAREDARRGRVHLVHLR